MLGVKVAKAAVRKHVPLSAAMSQPRLVCSDYREALVPIRHELKRALRTDRCLNVVVRKIQQARDRSSATRFVDAHPAERPQILLNSRPEVEQITAVLCMLKVHSPCGRGAGIDRTIAGICKVVDLASDAVLPAIDCRNFSNGAARKRESSSRKAALCSLSIFS